MSAVTSVINFGLRMIFSQTDIYSLSTSPNKYKKPRSNKKKICSQPTFVHKEARRKRRQKWLYISVHSFFNLMSTIRILKKSYQLHCLRYTEIPTHYIEIVLPICRDYSVSMDLYSKSHIDLLRNFVYWPLYNLICVPKCQSVRQFNMWPLYVAFIAWYERVNCLKFGSLM